MRLFKIYVFVAMVVLLNSCAAYKQVPYLINSKDYVASAEQLAGGLYDARIMPKDLITITVSTSDPEVAIPFNLTVPTTINNNSSLTTTSQPTLQRYLVDNDGSVSFPVLGELKVGGLTKSEAEKMIIERLKPYLKETPIVSVRMTNYNIAVLGEVVKPGTFTIDNEKVTIFEALAMAGDMTIYGQRADVKLIRENAKGERKVIELNINDANIINSPYYHLQQNDVIYVTPNQHKAKTSAITSSTTIWFTVVSTVVSLATLMVSILL